MNERLNELLENEEFMKGLVTCQSPEELANLFEKNSIVLDEELSIEDAFELVKKQESGELNDSELDAVSGGGIALGLAISSAALIIVSAGLVCFIAGYAYQKFRDYYQK